MDMANEGSGVVSVTPTERLYGAAVTSRNVYPARVALLESRYTARRNHYRISDDPGLRAAAKKEVAEQQQRAKQTLREAGSHNGDVDVWDYLKALWEHDPPEEKAAIALAKESTKTREVCGECGRQLVDNEPGYKGKTYTGMATLFGVGERYKNAILCAQCAPRYLVESRPGPDRFFVFVYEPCSVCERVTVFRTTWGMWHRKRHVFCCGRCEWTHYNGVRNERSARDREKVCEVCGEEFTASRRDAKTCSAACKQKAYRQRKDTETERKVAG